MTAEPIARMVNDLKSGRAESIGDEELTAMGLERIEGPTVIDATAIYRSVVRSVSKPEGISLYEDHPCIAPPWDEAMVCFVNKHDNVLALHSRSREVQLTDAPWTNAAEHADWTRVRWVIETLAWIGGRSPQVGPMATTGPVHAWQFAVYEDGEPADLHWIALMPEQSMDVWDVAQLTLLGALNFLNAANVELVEPTRPRAERRRLERIGVKVSTINVLSRSTSTRSPRTENGASSVPLTTVRGHWAHFGDCCPGRHEKRGLAFGRLQGRFWIPMHARGDADVGRSENDYVLRPD